MRTEKEIVSDLRCLLDEIKLAASMAKIEKPESEGILAVGYQESDKNGKIIMSFKSELFIEDMTALLEKYPPEEEETVDSHDT